MQNSKLDSIGMHANYCFFIQVKVVQQFEKCVYGSYCYVHLSEKKSVFALGVFKGNKLTACNVIW